MRKKTLRLSQLYPMVVKGSEDWVARSHRGVHGGDVWLVKKFLSITDAWGTELPSSSEIIEELKIEFRREIESSFDKDCAEIVWCAGGWGESSGEHGGVIDLLSERQCNLPPWLASLNLGTQSVVFKPSGSLGLVTWNGFYDTSVGKDWNLFWSLSSERSFVERFGGSFVVVRSGRVVCAGVDEQSTRRRGVATLEKDFGVCVDPLHLVVAWVDRPVE